MRVPTGKRASGTALGGGRRDLATYTITLLKSHLSCKGVFAHFGGLSASPSGSQTDARRVHRGSPDAVWGRVLAPSLLPTPSIASTPPRRRALPAAQQHLQHSGNVAGVVVSDHLGPRASRHDRAAAPEWGLPDTHRSARLSRSHGVAPIPPALRRPGIAEAPSPPRSVAWGDVPASDAADPCAVRLGLHSADAVRTAREGKHWLQPAQARPCLVPSLGVFRGADQGLLARRT